MHSNSLPKISVITVVRNGEQCIEKTIQSVLHQTYKNIEYIVVDGASTDNTLKIIRKFDHKIDKIVSEPDKGIYDAMNKGWRLATGDYVLFMNGGDRFYQDDSIEMIFSQKQTCDIVFADGIADVYNTKHPLPINSSGKIELYKFFCSTSLCHQATFIRRSLLNKIGGYSLDFKIISDHYFNYLAISKYNASTIYVSVPVAAIDVTGISMMDTNLLKCELQQMRKTFFDPVNEIKIFLYLKKWK